jgi:hypothetical protein
MAKATNYRICFKHDEHGSDELDITFRSSRAAERLIADLQGDPQACLAYDFEPWVADATLWVVDEDGEFA